MMHPLTILRSLGLGLLAASCVLAAGCRPSEPAAEQGAGLRIFATGDANNLYVVLAEGPGPASRFTYWQRDAAGLWHDPGSGVGMVVTCAAWREDLFVFFPGGRFGLFGLDKPQIGDPPKPKWNPLVVSEDGLAAEAIGQVGEELAYARYEKGAWQVDKIDLALKPEALHDPCAARYKGRLFLAWREEVPSLSGPGSTWRMHFAYLDEKGWKGPYPPQGTPGLAMESVPQIAATADTLLCLFRAPAADGKPAAWALAAYTTDDENWHETNRLASPSPKEPMVLARWRDRFCVATLAGARPSAALLEGQPLAVGPVAPIWPSQEAQAPTALGVVGLVLMVAMVMVLLLVSRWRGRLAREASAREPSAILLAEPHPLGRRAMAAAIDHLLVAMVVAPVAWYLFPDPLARWQQDLLMGRQGFTLGPEGWILEAVLLGAILVYFSAAEALTGRTVGKALLGLEVRSLSGGPISAKQAILRNALRIVDSLPWLYLVGVVSILMGPLPQRLGDRVAGTIVVRRKPPLPPAA
jgi:uncharacterized RDD family membrane protein YckC